MLIKVALIEACPVEQIKGEQSEVMIRTASGRVLIEPGSDKERIVQAEIKKHPNALFFRAKAIKADEPNSNGDSFSKKELLQAYKSFEGVPFFTNHENQDIEKAKGKIIFAEWDEEENSIFTIAFVDRDAYPHICRGIEQGYMTGVSMGASVEYSVCSICENKAERTEDYCEHIRNRKSRKFTGRARNVRTGNVEQYKDEPVFEHNFGIKFIELSGVVDPACPSCHIEGIIPNTDYLGKVANMENYLTMVKTAAMQKEASQEELDQIDEMLNNLEDIAVNLIKNRQQVEVEFASDLVDIIASLQTWTDELVGAGYGNMESNVPGTYEGEGMEGDQMATDPMAPADPMTQDGTAPREGAPAPAPVASQEAMSVGQTTGAPGKPLVNQPQMPITTPMRPAARSSSSIQRVAEQFESRFDLGSSILEKSASLCSKFNKTGVKTMGKRRTVASKEKQKEKARKVLSSSWQEKQNFFQYIREVPSLQVGDVKLSVKNRDDSFIIVAEDENSDRIQIWTYEDLSDDERELITKSPTTAAGNFLNIFATNTSSTKEGVERMSKEIKEAGANTVLPTPDVTIEKQLRDHTSELYHGRTGEEKHVTTQKQLDTASYARTGEKDVLTEKQLDDADLKLNPRQDAEPEVITQAQLDGDNGVSPRKDEDKHTVTQDQLDREGYRTNNEPDVLTERQLDQVDSPWARQANRDSSQFKSASQHMGAVVGAFASVSLETGATPQEMQAMARELVASTKSRYKLASTLLDEVEASESLPFATRVAYWNAKNVRVATASPTEVEHSLISKLRVIASDVTINPETIIDAIDVISDGEDGETSISNAVDQKLAEASTEEETKVNVKDELKNALKEAAGDKKWNFEKKDDDDDKDDKKDDDDCDDDDADCDDDDDTVEAKSKRDEEREEILASLASRKTVVASVEEDEVLNREKLNGADAVIDTTFEEVGTQKTASTFRRDIVTFAKGALAGENMKLASITNVTISGDTIQIAVQTDAGEESVEIPIGEEVSPIEGELLPEGDLEGEGLEEGLGMENINAPAYASNSKKLQKEAQSPMGGGMQGSGGEGAGGAPEQGLDSEIPGGDSALQTLTTGDEDGLEDEIPTVGEKQAPWSICPECGASDVDVTKEDDGGIIGQCNGCGAEYEALIKKTVEFKIIKPTKSVGEDGTEMPEGPEAPEEMPALPVAAQTKVDKNSLVRIASNKEANGEVCPSCGNCHCDVIASGHGSVDCACGACGTTFEKNLIVSSSDPSKGLLRVEWNLTPDESCPECLEEAKKFASKLKVSSLLKIASSKADSFPMSNCMERLARSYGGNTVAMYGPCKGKPLAECVCKELKVLGFTKARQLKKLAEASMQVDPMDECLEDQKSKGFDVVEASSICNCLKTKFASEVSENIYAHAFADEAAEGKIELNTYDLGTLNDTFNQEDEKIAKEAQAILDDVEIGADLDPLDSVEVEIDGIEEVGEEAGVSSVTITGDNLEIVEEVAGEEEIADDLAFDDVNGTDTLEGEGNMEGIDAGALADALSMNSSRVRRSGAESTIVVEAGKPKVIKTIEKNVDAGVPRSNATIRNEGADNIDVKMASPKVPRGSALMGHEQNVPVTLPDVPVDSSYMGQEKECQSGMPPINNEIKGTVIAQAEKNLIEAQRQLVEAKKVKEIDSVEKNVDAGVPRSKATIGHEGADNIDVALGTPDVPRSKATMGNEGSDNIDVKMDGPDVPIDSSYMGHEKETQEGMPKINDEMLKQVQMNRDQQLERIASARREEAVRTTAWLSSNKRIASDKATFDNVVTALANFEIDRIAGVAETMFPVTAAVTKTASTDGMTRTAGVGNIPAIILDTQAHVPQEQNFQTKLEDSFTIGSMLLNDRLGEDGSR